MNETGIIARAKNAARKLIYNRIIPKKTSFAAIDVGSHNIKCIEIDTSNGPPVVTALGIIRNPAALLDNQGKEDQLAATISELIKSSGIKMREVAATISSDRIIIRHVKLPLMPESELENALSYESSKIIPLPLSDLIIRHLNLGEVTTDGVKFHHLLLIAAPIALVYQYYDVFLRAGLTMVALDLPLLGLWRSVVGLKRTGSLQGTIGILDIGYSTTHFLVVRDGVLQFARVFYTGVKSLAVSLCDYYDINLEEAHDILENEGRLINSKRAMESACSEDVKMDFVLRDAMSGLIREIHRSIVYYTKQEHSVQAEKYLVYGGASKIKGFREFLCEALGSPVEIENLGLGISIDTKTLPACPEPLCAVAFGTALREMTIY